MTYQEDRTLPTEISEVITAGGLEGLPELIRILVNEALQQEREEHPGAAAYERTAERRGYANGYKPKTVKTRMGEISSRYRKCVKGISIQQRWRKGCGVNGH